MKILVINTGSSSIKYQLFDMERHRILASGVAEKIGEDISILTHWNVSAKGEDVEKVEECVISDHHEGMNRVLSLLIDPEHGAVRDKSEISAVGHRVVHGGEAFHSPTIIDESVIAAIKENIPLAPLHNPSNLMGIEVAGAIFPDSPQVAVFDTAFHQTIPMESYLYAIPFELYEKHRIRRYGFHGTSHAYVAERAAEYLRRPLGELNLITIHLGNGASMAALKNGISVDTTMGMTPLAGLVMGTRSGDIDPALTFFLADQLRMSVKECGSNDMREVIRKKDAGDDRAEIALKLYCYRIRKYIGAYFAALGSLNAIIFTAGIGENSPYIREHCCRGLHKLGIEIDAERNNKGSKEIREISLEGSEIRILVVPTNEELKIAQETEKVIEKIL
jgi:acetate kinase